MNKKNETSNNSKPMAYDALLCGVEHRLVNKPDYVESCVITVFEDDKILLNWSGEAYGHPIGESGFFLTMKAAKMYVGKHFGIKRTKWSVVDCNAT